MDNTQSTGLRAWNALTFLSAMLMAVSLLFVPQPARAMVDGINVSQDPLGNASGFVVSIQVYKNKGDPQFSQCLGAAIAPDIIITAGHCVSTARHVLVKFLKSASPVKVDTIDAKKWVVHPLYNGGYPEPMYSSFTRSEANQYHDLALIQLEKPSDYAKPVTIAPPEWDATLERADAPKYYIFGHGRDAIYKPVSEMWFAEMARPKKADGLDHFMMSTLVPKTALICMGDSGSPVSVAGPSQDVSGQRVHYLLGIQSSADGYGKLPDDMKEALKFWKKESNIPLCSNALSFFHVSYHREWIMDTLDEMGASKARSYTTWEPDYTAWMRAKDLNARPVATRAEGEKVFPSCMLGPRVVYTDIDGKCLDFTALQDGDEFKFKGKSVIYDAKHSGTFAEWVQEQTAQ